MDVAALLKRSFPHLSAAEANAYSAPYPDRSFKAGVRAFPNMVPDRPDAGGADLGRKAREWLKTQWKGPVFVLAGAMDPVLGVASMEYLRKQIRGAPPLEVMPDAGHFIQEWGQEAAERILRHFNKQAKL